MQLRNDEELDESYHVERSFRVTFADGERIHFFADTDQEMVQWVEALKKIVGIEVPPNAAWAQLAMEMAKTVANKSAARLSKPGGVPATPSAASRMQSDADETPKRPSMPRPSHARSQSHALATVTEAHTPPASAPAASSLRQQQPHQTRRVPVERPASVYVDRR